MEGTGDQGNPGSGELQELTAMNMVECSRAEANRQIQGEITMNVP